VSTVALSPILDSPARARSITSPVRFALIWMLRLGGVGVAVWAVWYGLRVRNDLWTWSSPVRFEGDIKNGLHQGGNVLDDADDLAKADGNLAGSHDAQGQVTWKYLLRSFVRRYDTVVDEAPDARYDLDYTPARLLVMTFWARYVRRVDPGGDRFAQEDALPLLQFNTACDIDAGVLMFLLVHHWVKRSRRAPGAEAGRRLGASRFWASRFWVRESAWMIALLAALVCWFNPSTLLDAHIWPQWDVWIVPFYLGAMYLASLELWFCAGVTVAVGAMFKGQIMMVAPVLALWPLFGGRWSGALRVVLGFFFGAALCASPWLARNREAWEWIGSVLLLGLVLVVIGSSRGKRSPRKRGRWPIWSLLFIVSLVARPCGLTNPYGVALGMAVALTPWLARHLGRAGSVIWLAVIATACLFLSASVFAGTWSWFKVGFEFPTRHFLNMANGGASNLPAILGNFYQWNVTDVVFQLGHWDVPMKMLLIAIYSLTVVLCAVGASLHDRRNDPRVLISLTAPWVLMFAILPQMHERYLVWGAAVGAVGFASSLGMGLMDLVVAGISLAMVGRDLLSRDQDFQPLAYELFSGTHPGIGWMVALAAAIYLYVGVIPGRRNAE
jgi:hypothetical protein